MNFCPDCGGKVEKDSVYCPTCGYALNTMVQGDAEKDKKIRDLEQKVAHLERSLESKSGRKSPMPQNFPFWIIPVTVIAFFGMFALIIFIVLSR